MTPLVYHRLFDEHPETRTMFRTEGSELVKGSMLALTIEAILDFAGPRSGHFRMIECEVSSHDAYGTPRELFIAFFGVITETLRDLLGAEWSAEMDPAWQRLLVEIGLAAQRPALLAPAAPTRPRRPSARIQPHKRSPTPWHQLQL